MSATFSELGGIVVDGDVIAREVVEPGTEGLTRLVEAFGDGILTEDGALNRPALAAIAIFQFMGAWNDFLGPSDCCQELVLQARD